MMDSVFTMYVALRKPQMCSTTDYHQQTRCKVISGHLSDGHTVIGGQCECFPLVCVCGHMYAWFSGVVHSLGM